MIAILKKITCLQILLLATGGLLIASMMIVAQLLLPAYDQWMALREDLQAGGDQYAMLVHNVAISKSIQKEYEREAKAAVQDQTDQVTLSNYLRTLESMARKPSITINNIKPLPVKDERDCKVYAVKMTLGGKLPEIMQFASEVTNGDSVIGIESSSLRGVQGDSVVECSFEFRMIRLKLHKRPSSDKPRG